MPNATETFANFAIMTVVESAANTLTFKKLEAGINIYSKTGWILNRVEYYPGASFGLFNSSGDSLTIGITQSNTLSSIDPTEPGVLARERILYEAFGTAATGLLVPDPVVQDFSSLPGGGILVLPNPIYLAAAGSGLSGASTVTARLWYTQVTLSDADYFELLQLRSVIQS
jgi:hypothetical protein